MMNARRVAVGMVGRPFLLLMALGAAHSARAAYGERDVSYPYATLGALGSPVSGVTGVRNGIGVVQLSGWTFPFAGQTRPIA